MDARPASDEEDENNEGGHQGRSAGHGGEGSHPQQSSSSAPSRNSSDVDAQGSSRGGSIWRRVREVPVSPAPLYKDCLVMYATPPGMTMG